MVVRAAVLAHAPYTATLEFTGSLFVHGPQLDADALALNVPSGHAPHHRSRLDGLCLPAGQFTHTAFVVCVPSHTTLGCVPTGHLYPASLSPPVQGGHPSACEPAGHDTYTWPFPVQTQRVQVATPATVWL